MAELTDRELLINNGFIRVKHYKVNWTWVLPDDPQGVITRICNSHHLAEKIYTDLDEGGYAMKLKLTKIWSDGLEETIKES